MFLRTAWLVLRKDVAIEARSWEVLTTTLFFSTACVLVFAIAFVKDGRAVEDAAAGILWIAIAFAGTLALGRTFEREALPHAAREAADRIVRAIAQPGPLQSRIDDAEGIEPV